MSVDPELDRDYQLAEPVALAWIDAYREAEAAARAAGDEQSAQDARGRREALERNLARIERFRSGKALQLQLAKWRALVIAHRATGKARPKLIEVAEQMGWNSEQPLRDYCRELGIADWHDVHAIVAAARI